MATEPSPGGLQPPQRKQLEELQLLVGQGVTKVGLVARRVGGSASQSAVMLGRTDLAKATAAASLEAARFTVDRTKSAFDRLTDPNYGAFWEPRNDRFSSIPWYERQLVADTCELPVDPSPALTMLLPHKAENGDTVTPLPIGRFLSTPQAPALDAARADGAPPPARPPPHAPRGHTHAVPGGGMDGEDEAEGEEDDWGVDSEEEASYQLATTKIAAPPRFTEARSCFACGHLFGLARYRHHCRACGRSFCHAHSSHAKALPSVGYLTPVRLCDGCFTKHTADEKEQRIAWRHARFDAYSRARLIPYFDRAVDTAANKALRVLEGTLFVARRAPLSASATIAVEVMDVLWRYGPPGLAGLVLRREFIEAAELLRRVSRLDKAWPLSAHELTAAMYYLLALKRGERGAIPDLEVMEHATDNCAAKPVDHSVLEALLRVAPFALHFIYDHTPAEMQLRAAQRGWHLLFLQEHAAPEAPAYAVFAREDSDSEGSMGNLSGSGGGGGDGGDAASDGDTCKQVLLSVRGTNSLQDVVTDIRAIPVPFPPPPRRAAAAAASSSSSSSTAATPPSSPPSPRDKRAPRARHDADGTHAAASTSTSSASSSTTTSSSSASSSSNPARMPVGGVRRSLSNNSTGGRLDGWADDVPSTVACMGMAKSALWMFDELLPFFLRVHAQGYRVVLTGHSLGGAVASLLGVLLKQEMPDLALHVHAFGAPACMDHALSEMCRPWTTSVVLHDDVIPRLTPVAVRHLMSELLRQRHRCMKFWWRDLEAVWGRVQGLWTPRWRESFLRQQNRIAGKPATEEEPAEDELEKDGGAATAAASGAQQPTPATGKGTGQVEQDERQRLAVGTRVQAWGIRVQPTSHTRASTDDGSSTRTKAGSSGSPHPTGPASLPPTTQAEPQHEHQRKDGISVEGSLALSLLGQSPPPTPPMLPSEPPASSVPEMDLLDLDAGSPGHDHPSPREEASLGLAAAPGVTAAAAGGGSAGGAGAAEGARPAAAATGKDPDATARPARSPRNSRNLGVVVDVRDEQGQMLEATWHMGTVTGMISPPLPPGCDPSGGGGGNGRGGMPRHFDDSIDDASLSAAHGALDEEADLPILTHTPSDDRGADHRYTIDFDDPSVKPAVTGTGSLPARLVEPLHLSTTTSDGHAFLEASAEMDGAGSAELDPLGPLDSDLTPLGGGAPRASRGHGSTSSEYTAAKRPRILGRVQAENTGF